MLDLYVSHQLPGGSAGLNLFRPTFWSTCYQKLGILESWVTQKAGLRTTKSNNGHKKKLGPGSWEYQEDGYDPPESWVQNPPIPTPPPQKKKKKRKNWGLSGYRPQKVGGPSKLACLAPKAGFNYMDNVADSHIPHAGPLLNEVCQILLHWHQLQKFCAKRPHV